MSAPIGFVARLGAMVVLVGLLGACTPKNQCAGDADCVNHNPDGFAVCDPVLEACLSVTCLQDEHCDIGSYCGENNACIPGCSGDADCRAGETCDLNNHACVAYGCRNSELDCAVGESCNTSTGACEGTSVPHCKSCTYDPWFGDNDCPNTAECVSYQDRPNDTFCMYTCSTQDDCPRGFDCIQALQGSSAKYCAAFCPAYWDLGVINPQTGTQK